MDDKRLLVVSNRLPIVVSEQEGNWQITPGSGGLVTALEPVIRGQGGTWVGWPGCDSSVPLDELLDHFRQEQGYQLGAVPLGDDEVERYYRGFSNETLWPLFHDLLGHCHFSGTNWTTYQEVNRKFAAATADLADEDHIVWIHDYQLALVGHHLREMGVEQTLGYFLHIPFPSLDLFRRLPWKEELMRGLLDYDLLGFQTLRDRRNFVQCATALIPGVETVRRHRHFSVLRHGERLVRVGHFPISIDFNEFDQGARSHEVDEAAWYLHENLQGRQLVLGIDRLDYTKGLPERLYAFERALEMAPELHGNITLLQVVVPSRTLVPDYQNLKELLDREVGRINARFSQSGWVPIHYIYRSLDRTQLLAHYRTSEVAFITPLRDGMNLVAKEYCACSIDNNGVLLLSEFAGAADQLGQHALLVNPYDLDRTAGAIIEAFKMPTDERRFRMSRLRNEVKRNDVHRWVGRFLNVLQMPLPQG
ncbi:MAG: trehalose-6-phosphate synthase [Desulfuromonas sp.]|nr:MAG: trehalose-6-phosphate synthase [Desulfuromonas sp.]